MNNNFESYSKPSFFNQNAVCAIPASNWRGPRIDDSAKNQVVSSRQDTANKNNAISAPSRASDALIPSGQIDFEQPISFTNNKSIEAKLVLRFSAAKGQFELRGVVKAFVIEFSFGVYFALLDAKYPNRATAKGTIKLDPATLIPKWKSFSVELVTQMVAITDLLRDMDFVDLRKYAIEPPEVKYEVKVSGNDVFAVFTISFKVNIKEFRRVYFDETLQSSSSGLGSIVNFSENSFFEVSFKKELEFDGLQSNIDKILKTTNDLTIKKSKIENMHNLLSEGNLSEKEKARIAQEVANLKVDVKKLTNELTEYRSEFKSIVSKTFKSKIFQNAKSFFSASGQKLETIIFKDEKVYGAVSRALKDLDTLAVKLFQRMKSRIIDSIRKKLPVMLSRVLGGASGAASGIGALVALVEAILLIYDLIDILWITLPLLVDIFPFAIPEFISLVKIINDTIREYLSNKFGEISAILDKQYIDQTALKNDIEEKLKNQTQAIRDNIKTIETKTRELEKKIVEEEQRLNDPANGSPLDTSPVGDRIPASDTNLRELNNEYYRLLADRRELQKKLVDIETPYQKKLETVNADLKACKIYSEKVKNFSVKFDEALKLSDDHLEAINKQKLPEAVDPETGLVPLSVGLKL